jgi:hypothetical protein
LKTAESPKIAITRAQKRRAWTGPSTRSPSTGDLRTSGPIDAVIRDVKTSLRFNRAPSFHIYTRDQITSVPRIRSRMSPGADQRRKIMKEDLTLVIIGPNRLELLSVKRNPGGRSDLAEWLPPGSSFIETPKGLAAGKRPMVHFMNLPTIYHTLIKMSGFFLKIRKKMQFFFCPGARQ